MIQKVMSKRRGDASHGTQKIKVYETAVGSKGRGTEVTESIPW